MIRRGLWNLPSTRWFRRGSKRPFSAMRLIFFGHFSMFFSVSAAFSAANASVDSLYFIVISISIHPAVDPMFSNSSSDFESSNRNERDACLSEEWLLDRILIVSAMAFVFAMITCKI